MTLPLHPYCRLFWLCSCTSSRIFSILHSSENKRRYQFIFTVVNKITFQKSTEEKGGISVENFRTKTQEKIVVLRFSLLLSTYFHAKSMSIHNFIAKTCQSQNTETQNYDFSTCFRAKIFNQHSSFFSIPYFIYNKRFIFPRFVLRDSTTTAVYCNIFHIFHGLVHILEKYVSFFQRCLSFCLNLIVRLKNQCCHTRNSNFTPTTFYSCRHIFIFYEEFFFLGTLTCLWESASELMFQHFCNIITGLENRFENMKGPRL